MALFPPMEFGGPSYSYSGQPSTSLFSQPSRGTLKRGGLFDRSSRKSRRRVQVLDPFFTSADVLQPDLHGLQSHTGHVPSSRYPDPLVARDASKFAAVKATPLPAFDATPLPAFDALRSVPTQAPLKSTIIAKPSIPASLPLPNDLELLKQNRLEFIAELFITIVTTRADSLSLLASSTNVLHPEETIYKFKDVNSLIQPSLTRSTSGGGKDVFSSMYRPQAAKGTKCTLTGRNTRLWRMAVASILLQSVPWSAFDRGEGQQQGLDQKEGEGPFHLASDNFTILFELLYQITAYSTRGIEMTAIASKKAIFDMVCDYTVLGSSASSEAEMKNGADTKPKKIDYLSEVDEYQGRLLIYMAQVVAYFLIPNRPDPLLVKKLGNHPDIQGIVESTPAQVPSFSQVPQYLARMTRELEEIKYLLTCLDEGRFEPNLEDLRGQIMQLPPPLPLRKGLFTD